MRRLYIRGLSDDTFARLAVRAARARRDIRDEAALIIERSVEKEAGADGQNDEAESGHVGVAAS